METRPSHHDARHQVAGTRQEQEAGTKIRDEEVIDLLLLSLDEKSLPHRLKTNTDLEMRFLLLKNSMLAKQYVAKQNALDANEILKICQMDPWDHSWQPRLSGYPIEIAHDLDIAVRCAIYRVPPFELVKCGLGYSHKANFIEAILRAACTVRDSLRENHQSSPRIKGIYIQVEEILSQRHNRLAHWIVASSLYQTTDGPYDALALDLAPIPRTFAEKKHVIRERLDDLDCQFPYIDQKCDWNKCSADLSFWKNVQQTVWSGNPDFPAGVAVSSKVTQTKRVSSKRLAIFKRLRTLFRWRGLG